MPPGLERMFATEFLQVEVSTPRPPAFTGGKAIMVRLDGIRNRGVPQAAGRPLSLHIRWQYLRAQ